MLTIIGTGPGDPDQLTLAAVKAVQSAHVIFTPRAAITRESAALNIIKAHVTNQRVEEIVYPLSRHKEELSAFWNTAAKRVAAAAWGGGVPSADPSTPGGTKVVFPTLGDPSVFSTWSYLKSALLEQGYSDDQWEVLPGISSFSHGAARLSRELCIGEDRFCVIPCPSSPADLEETIGRFDTLVIMKIGRNWPQLRRWLAASQHPVDAYLVSRIGHAEELVGPLSLVEPGQEGSLSLAIVSKKHGR